MPAPDLPMRERIAEALYRENRLHVTPWALVGDEVQGIYLARADAVVPVVTTPSEAMVRAGIKASFNHVISFKMTGDGINEPIVRTHSCECGETWTAHDPSSESLTHRMTAILTAALADEKEARG